jgi:hypothetical protein
MKTKLISRAFNKHGYAYRQIDREGMAAIYEMTRENVKAYEVVIIQVGPPHPQDKDPFDGLVERMPGTEQFGNLGWGYNTESEAREKFAKVIKRLENKIQQ